MYVLSQLAHSFSAIINGTTLLAIFTGVIIGTLVGILPGLGSPAGVALLLPLTYAMDPTAALSMLAGVWYGSTYGGMVTAALLNIPGEGDSVISTLDGFQMTKQGRGGVALGVSALGGFFAGTIALIVLMILGPKVAAYSLNFGPPEIFSLMFLGLTIVSWLSGNSIIKGLIATIIGLLIGTIGLDVMSGEPRLTFGSIQLLSGIGFVPAVVGLFGLSEVLATIGGTVNEIGKTKFSLGIKNLLPPKKELKPSCFAALRGTLIGFIIGVIPGAGPTVSTFISYATEKRLSKTPDRFGKGAIEGIAGPQSSSHSATIAGMIPLLCLGIPASGTAAVLLGGFLVHGLQPGPLLFMEHPEVVWGMIASLYLANVILLLLNTVSIPFFIWLLKISQKYIYPVIGVLTLIGAYSLNNNIFDVWLALAFGLLGFFFRTLEIPLAPLVIALVLGKKAEITCRQSLVMFDGNALRLFERPISLLLITCAIVILVFPLIASLYKKIGKRELA